jgi:hypothetical protein
MTQRLTFAPPAREERKTPRGAIARLRWKDSSLRCLQALIGLDEVMPVNRLAAGEVGVHVWLANTADAGRKGPKMPKNKETRIGGLGRRSGSRGNAGGGNPHFSLFKLGQRITVAPAASATAQAVTKVFAGAVQLVT